LNRDASATNNTLPQSGQFGRLKSSVARTRGDGYADCKVIVDPPRRQLTAPHLPPWCAARMARQRRLRETKVAVETENATRPLFHHTDKCCAAKMFRRTRRNRPAARS
jgi:hypothetical protein